ncbi:MAG: hypothetical protein ABIJ40_06675 [Bacteroidota bacterium]
MSDYTNLFKDVRWQKKRLEVLDANNWECENCGDKEKTLNVHHRYYTKGKKPWEYENEELICLCENCHSDYHVVLDEFKTIGVLNISSLYRLFGYLQCLLHEDGGIEMSKLIPLNYEHAQGIADYLKKDVYEFIEQFRTKKNE